MSNESVQWRRQFVEDGVICVRNALDPASLRMAEEAFNWSLENPGPYASEFPGTAAAPSRFYQDLLNPRACEVYEPMLQASSAPDLIAELWNAPEVWFFYEQVFLKEGGESRRTPWHQDSSYLPIEGARLAVMWISFEPLARADSLEFIRGSHRGSLYDGSRFDPNDDTAPLYGTLPRLPDIERQRTHYEIISWATEPGDVIVFHPRMLHGGAPTHAGRRRRTLSLRFFGDDAVFASRPGNLGAPDGEAESRLADIRLGLREGQPFRHPRFPQVRPRRSL